MSVDLAWIQSHCDEAALQQARRLKSEDSRIYTRLCAYEGQAARLSATFVDGKSWERLRTFILIDPFDGTFQDCGCSCSAHRSDASVCEHIAALSLLFDTSPETFIGYQPQRKSATSPMLLEYLQEQEEPEHVTDVGNISLELTLQRGYASWQASFRVHGHAAAYAVKSLGAFITDIRSGAVTSYGKKLCFKHEPSAFDGFSSHLVRFLEGAVDARTMGVNPWYSHRRGFAYAQVGRELELSDKEVLDLLDLHRDGHPFRFLDGRGVSKVEYRGQVLECDPDLTLRVVPASGGRFELLRDTGLAFVHDVDRLYAFGSGLFYRCSTLLGRSASFLTDIYASEEPVYLSVKDAPRFCAAVLPALKDVAVVDLPQELEAYRPIPCTPEFFLDRDEQGVSCRVDGIYGPWRHTVMGPAFEEGPEEHPAPDREGEKRVRALVLRYFLASDKAGYLRIAERDEDRLADLLFGGLAAFAKLGTVYTTPSFDRLLFERPARISVGVSYKGDLIDLDITTQDFPPSEINALLSSYRRRKTYHRLKSGAFMDITQFELADLDALSEELDLTARQIDEGKLSLPGYRAFSLDALLSEDCKDESFRGFVDGFPATPPEDYEVPAGLKTTLRPYQEEGFRWLSLLVDRGFGGILADEMGLGKTVQLIALLLSRRSELEQKGPALVVCPASLVYNWIAEFERFAPELAAVALAGTKKERDRLRATPGTEVFVTSYDTLRIDIDGLTGKRLSFAVLDEAQYIKNHATKVAHAVKKLDATHRIALTGTPIENRLSELWSIFDFLMPGLLGSYKRFRERYELPIMEEGEDSDEVQQRLHDVVAPFILRRLKGDVLPDLPHKMESVVSCRLVPEQRKLYDAHEQRLRSVLSHTDEGAFATDRIAILAEITKLRELCCDPALLFEGYKGGSAKLDVLEGLVQATVESGNKMLVFSQFTSFLRNIANRLDEAGIAYYTITGATPKKKRLSLVEAFNGDEVPVFLISLKAGGTGLNLTGASVVVHADPWWNAAAQNQATDRAHRIGQTQAVNVYQVIAQDTIEERILKLQERKADLGEKVVEASNGASLATLSREELIGLLQDRT